MNIQNVLLYSSNAGMETSKPLVNVIVNNGLFHSTHTSIRCYSESLTHKPRLLSGRLVAQSL